MHSFCIKFNIQMLQLTAAVILSECGAGNVCWPSGSVLISQLNKYMSVHQLRSTSKLFRSLKIKVKEKNWILFEIIDFELNFENVWFYLVQYELVCFRLVWFGHYLFWFDQSCLSEVGLVWSSGWVWFSLVNPQTNKQNKKIIQFLLFNV